MRSRLKFTIVYRTFSDRKQIFSLRNRRKSKRFAFEIVRNSKLHEPNVPSIQKLVNCLLFTLSKSFWLFVLDERKHIFEQWMCCSMFIVQLRLLIWIGSECNRYETAMVFQEIVENFVCKFVRNNIFYYLVEIIKPLAHWNYFRQYRAQIQ